MRPLLIAVLLATSTHALRAQSEVRLVDVQLAAIEHILTDLVPESSFCLARPARAQSYSDWRDTTDVLEPPSSREFEELRAAAEDRFSHQALPYCITRPNDGFESDLERIITFGIEREASHAAGRPYFGRTYWKVGPYGQRAVQIFLSRPQILENGHAVVGFYHVRGNGSDTRRCEFRLEDSRWVLVEECVGFNIRA